MCIRDSVFAAVEFTAHRCAVFIGCNGVYDLALLISDSAGLRDNILCGDDLIDRTGKSTLFILRLIDGGQFVSAFIYAADDGKMCIRDRSALVLRYA